MARKVLYLNPGGVSTGRHRAEWERLLIDEKPDVVVLAETHLCDPEFPRGFRTRRAFPPRPVKAVRRLFLNGQYSIAARMDGDEWIRSRGDGCKSKAGGVAVLIRDDVADPVVTKEIRVEDPVKGVQACGVTLEDACNVLALYMPPNRRLKGDLSFVADAIPACHKGLPTYIIGDMNCGPSYGENYSEAKKRWRELSTWLEQAGSDWMVLSPEVPTFETASALTTPDRCLLRANAVDAPMVVALFNDTFRVSEDYPSLGPHRPMVFSVWGAKARVRRARGVSQRRKPGRNQWDIEGVGAARTRETFRGSIHSLPDPLGGPLSSVVRGLTKRVKEAVRRSVPRREAGVPGRKCRDTDEVKTLRDRVRMETDKDAKESLVEELEDAKRRSDSRSYHEKLEDLDAKAPLTGDLFKMIRAIEAEGEHFSIPNALLDKRATDGEKWVWSTAEKAKLLLRDFTEPMCPSDGLAEFGITRRCRKRRALRSLRERLRSKTKGDVIKKTYVEVAIESLSNKKAPGEDGLEGEAWKAVGVELVPYLTALFNRILEEGCTPPSFKRALMVPILKPGKRPELTTSYRVIQLTDVVARIYERSLLISQAPILLKDISDFQFGYTHGRGAEEILMELVEDLSFRDGDSSTVLFCDQSQAFGRLDHLRLFEQLLETDMDGRAIRALMGFVQGRRGAVRLSGNGYFQTKHKLLKQGVPQGTSLGPILFLFNTNDLPSMLSATIEGWKAKWDPENLVEVKFRVFADDIHVRVTAPCRELRRSLLQTVLNALAEWSSPRGYALNASKTEYCGYGKAREEGMQLFLYGQEIRRNAAPLLLGLILDKNLRFEEQANKAIASMRARAGALRRMTSRDAGVSRRSAVLLLTNYIVGSVIYALGVYYPNLSAVSKSRMQKTLNLAERVAVGLPMSTRLEVLHKVSNTHTVEGLARKSHLSILDRMRRVEGVSAEAFRAWEKRRGKRWCRDELLAFWGWSGFPPHTERVTGPMTALALAQKDQVRDRGGLVLRWRDPVQDDDEVRSLCCEGEELVFADGSRAADTGASGIGVVFFDSSYLAPRKVVSRSAGCHGSSYTVEVEALMVALRFADPTARRTRVFTDSQSALRALAGAPQDPVQLALSRCLFDEVVGGGKRFALYFCRGHSGIRGNEMADALADFRRHAHQDTAILHSTEMVRNLARNRLSVLSWASVLGARTNGQPSYTCRMFLEATGRRRPLGQLRGSNVRADKTWIQLLTANSHWCGDYLQKIGRRRVSTCILCGAQSGNLKHVVEKCPFLAAARLERLALEDLNSVKGQEFVMRACEFVEANYAKAWQPDFILPYERGAKRSR